MGIVVQRRKLLTDLSMINAQRFLRVGRRPVAIVIVRRVGPRTGNCALLAGRSVPSR